MLLSCYIYFGLLSLYTILCNPFGDDACDFPVAAYQAIIARVLIGIVGL